MRTSSIPTSCSPVRALSVKRFVKKEYSSEDQETCSFMPKLKITRPRLGCSEPPNSDFGHHHVRRKQVIDSPDSWPRTLCWKQASSPSMVVNCWVVQTYHDILRITMMTPTISAVWTCHERLQRERHTSLSWTVTLIHFAPFPYFCVLLLLPCVHFPQISPAVTCKVRRRHHSIESTPSEVAPAGS